MLGFCCGMGLDVNLTPRGVGTCLGLILDDASLKMLKNCFCLCSCVCGLWLAYAVCIHVYAAFFLHT